MELAGLAIDEASGTRIVILRELDIPHRLLPIVVGMFEADAIAIGLSGVDRVRPGTHDLLAAIVEGMHGHLQAVEVTEIRDGAFLANLSVQGPGGDHVRVDSRPSDAIALAVRLGAPLFAADAVVDEAGTFLEEPMTDEDVEDAVRDFRSFLDEVDPVQFGGSDDAEEDDGT